MGYINIDGVKTREIIGKMEGKQNGIHQLCNRIGVPSATVSNICRNGYGREETINDLIRKGIPMVVSSDPVPCRAKKAHQRKPKDALKHEQVGLDILNETEGEGEEAEAMIMDKEATLFITKVKALEWKKCEVQILESVKNACKSIIEQIEIIESNQIYKSLFGGEEE